MKQTAVEWLYNELSKNNTSIDSVIERINKESSIWEQAKQMEKEQIIDAWQEAYVTGCVVGSNDYTNEDEETDNGAYYYDQTYNQNK